MCLLNGRISKLNQVHEIEKNSMTLSAKCLATHKSFAVPQNYALTLVKLPSNKF